MRGILLAVAIIVTGCGGDAGAPVDAGPDAVTYPAFGLPPLPVSKGPGYPMSSVRVVPVFFANDPLHDQIVDDLTKYAASPYWTAQVGEYGVGALTVGAPVELTDTSPPSTTDSDIISFLQSSLDGTHPEWGPTDTHTVATSIYLLEYQDGTTVDAPRVGTMCTDWIAFHWHVPDPGHGASIIYGVIPRCAITPNAPYRTVLDEVSSAMNHELVEAATDPLLDAWNWYTDKTLGWAIALGGEVGDLCSDSYHSYYTPADVGHMIQRSWSNASARAEHDPCVPEVPGDGPYFNSIVPAPDLLTLQLGGQQRTLNGIAVPVGGSKTVPLSLFSEAPTSGAWQVQAYEDSPDQLVQFSFDQNGGENGDTIQMTVHLTAAPSQGFAACTLVNVLGDRDTEWQFVVAPKP